MKKIIGFVKRHPVLIPILIFIVLRIPSLFEGYWYGDEGIYASVAQGMHQGKLIFNDIWDHKPPLIEWLYFIEGFRGWEFGLFLVKLTSIVFGVFSLGFLGKISAEFSKKKSFTFWVLIFASFFLGSPILEGNIAGGEVFFILFNITLFYYLLKEKKPIIIGFLLFLAFLIKPQSFIESGFMISCWLIIKIISKKKFFPFFLKTILGFVIPLAIYTIILFLQNNIGGFIDAVFVQNFAYSGDYESNILIFGVSISAKILKVLLLAVIFIVSLGLFKKKKFGYQIFLLINLFNIELFMVLFSGRSYPHYLIQLIPSLSLIFGFAITNHFYFKINWYKLMSLYGLLLMLVLFLMSKSDSLGLNMFYMSPVQYYGSFVKYISTPDKTKFSDSIEIWQNTGLSNRLSTFTDYFNDKYKGIKSCYIYTESAWTVALTDLPFTNKYVVWFHLGFSDIRMQEAIAQLNNSEVLVVDNKAPVKYDEFFKNLSDFKLLEERNDFLIYQRIVK